MEPSTPGAISLSSSSHFALKPYSNIIKPVALPPGWARLSTKPAPTGSGTITNTIGTVRVASNTAAAPALPLATMTSNASAANSVAALLVSAASPAPQRASICRLRPSIQPSSRSRCKKTATQRPWPAAPIPSPRTRWWAAWRPAARAPRAATRLHRRAA